jgi:hypothetical protein
MTDHLTSRAQRLIDEFEEGEDICHGIANVLTHLAYAFDQVCDGEGESMVGVPVSTLDALAMELTVPAISATVDEPNSAAPSFAMVEQWVSEVWHEGTPVRVALSDVHIAMCAAKWGYQQCNAEYERAAMDIYPPIDGVPSNGN